MIGQGKLNGQVEPDEALKEEPGGGVPDERVLLRPDGLVPEGVLEEGRYHLQVSQGAGLVTDSSLDIRAPDGQVPIGAGRTQGAPK